MTVREFANKLNMKVLTGEVGLEREVKGVYVCDLLSWVMSRADKGDAWITVLTNVNTVAVALLAETSCIIIPEGIKVEEATVKRAGQENIALLSSKMYAYDICWKAHEILGIKDETSS
ncbi:MAG: DRTGG domain-containing protein [Acetivibrionales bacterium]|jgi:predicted transcriptional regulator